MHTYRTHTCGELRTEHEGRTVRLSGWVYRKRDHGGLIFIDLRDHYGVTQVVAYPDRAFFGVCEKVRLESVITATGVVKARSPETVNPDLPTGGVEIAIDDLAVQSEVSEIPIYVAGEEDGPEDIRLRYRFIDLRRPRIHRNIVLRSKVISDIRRRMVEHGFLEYQTPILTASSPEGARDYLVPSRVHPGKFYALPQAPQMFKQLLMISGFDRYFQIAPCFRDEDARADRSPGEFYQLDVEMSFVTQDDVFAVVEDVLHGVFKQFGAFGAMDAPPFVRIPYAQALVRYGTDKPDLRIPIAMADVSDIFVRTEFRAFKAAVEQGGVVRAIPVKGIASRPRSFLDRMEDYAKSLGAKGMGYMIWSGGACKGPIAKFLAEPVLRELCDRCGTGEGDVMFFLADKAEAVNRIAGDIRVRLGRELDIVEKDVYRFCWVVDFPMYERDAETGQIVFSHNPFSMPQGGMEALNTRDPLDVHAYQYDIVCNGVELSSGAIRNHRPDVMFRAFEIAGYSKEDVEEKFGGLLRAFRAGAPPHGGIAPGIDRIVMLLANESNIREVIAFPMNQRAEDLMMGAPAPATAKQLRELHIKVDLPPEEPKPEPRA